MNIKIKSPIAILGYGVEGQAAFSFLKNQGYSDITICDEGEDKNAFKDLTGFSTLIRSPGVHYNRPEIKKARDAGALITSMTELALEIAKDRITAITGSNGKTTTTALTAEILKKHYRGNLIVGGNDRKPTVEEALENPDWPILMEVSSFQFADLKMSPHIAAVLNITPNHLDWHEDLEDYINAKNNVILHQGKNDWAILNAGNENSTKLAQSARSKVFWINANKGNSSAIWDNSALLVNGTFVIDLNDVKVKTHPDNILFSAAIANIHNVPNETIAEVMKEFGGVEHRLEFVRKINGVNFYNDSSCTTPESSEVAIDQFPENELILMLGGSSKKADYGFLAAKIKNHNTRVYLYGAEGENIKKAIEEAGAKDQIIKYNTSGNFEEIIRDVLSHGKEGDNIVLSPACASFDMFNNAKERGRIFKEIVNNL